MKCLSMFLAFLKVGAFAFGGAYGAIPLIREIVISNGWMDDELFTYMIAVSESTPGPIMTNLATYVGTSQAGLLGGILATLGVVLPSFVIILLITALLSKVRDNKYVQATLRGIKPCMVGFILFTGARMTVCNLFAGSVTAPDLRAMLITAALALLFFGIKKKKKKELSPITLVLIAAAAGIAVYGI